MFFVILAIIIEKVCRTIEVNENVILFQLDE